MNSTWRTRIKSWSNSRHDAGSIKVLVHALILTSHFIRSSSFLTFNPNFLCFFSLAYRKGPEEIRELDFEVNKTYGRYSCTVDLENARVYFGAPLYVCSLFYGVCPQFSVLFNICQIFRSADGNNPKTDPRIEDWLVASLRHLDRLITRLIDWSIDNSPINQLFDR